MDAHKKHHHKKHQHYTNDSVEGESKPQASFFTRIITIPIVNDSVSTFHQYFKAVPYSDFVIDKSKATLSTVHTYAQPYVEPVHQRLQPHIEKVDELAGKALDNLGQKFPAINQPTSEIFDSVTGPPRQYYSSVKKTVETNVTEPATQAATTIAKGVNDRAMVIVDNFEAIVDRFLPTEGVSRPSSEETSSNQVVRLYGITTSLPIRVGTLVNNQLDQHHIPHTTEDFIKLRDTNALLRDTTAKIEALNAQLNHWVAISKELAAQKVGEAKTKVVQGFDTTITTVTANEKVQFYTQEILNTLDKAAAYAKQHGPTMPEYIQQRLDPLFTFANNQYQLVATELKKPNLLPSEKAKNVLALTQQQVLPLMKKSLDDVAEQIRAYQQHYLAESERVLDSFKTSLKGLGVPVK